MLRSQQPATQQPGPGAAISRSQNQTQAHEPTEAELECIAPCDPYPGKKKLLVVADVQTGFQHDAINHAMGVIEEMGRKTGIYAAFLRTDSQLITKGKITVTSKRYANRSINVRNLNYFDGLVLLGSGEGTLSDQQKADLLSFVHDDGKGLILGHAQGVNFYNWPDFSEMIGGFMAGEYPATGMYAKVVDPSWKAAAAFGKQSFLWVDQWPILKPEFKPGSVHTIIALDPSKMTEKERARRSDDYFPIVWAKDYGKGRVFNFTGGHNDATLDDPRSQALLLEGIEGPSGSSTRT
jgi:type 1 glutamine amidotransferase